MPYFVSFWISKTLGISGVTISLFPMLDNMCEKHFSSLAFHFLGIHRLNIINFWNIFFSLSFSPTVEVKDTTKTFELASCCWGCSAPGCLRSITVPRSCHPLQWARNVFVHPHSSNCANTGFQVSGIFSYSVLITTIENESILYANILIHCGGNLRVLLLKFRLKFDFV